jgi:hypothetical protein
MHPLMNDTKWDELRQPGTNWMTWRPVGAREMWKLDTFPNGIVNGFTTSVRVATSSSSGSRSLSIASNNEEPFWQSLFEYTSQVNGRSAGTEFSVM